MFDQSMTADVGQRLGSIVIDPSSAGSTFCQRDTASTAASLRIERSAVSSAG